MATARNKWWYVPFAAVITIGLGYAPSAFPKQVNAPSATAFQVTSNPVVRHDSGLKHYSSDPSAIEMVDSNNNHVLVLVSSRDLENRDDAKDWPMNQTYLYATFGSTAGDPIAATWYDHGPVLSESQFNKWATTSNHLWAPDIQVFGNEVWLYVPAQLSKDVWRVGTAHASISNGIYADTGFTADSSYISIPGSPNNGYTFDPGVFLDQVNMSNTGTYMVYQDALFNNSNNLSIAKLGSDHRTATYIGKIKINGAPSKFSPSSHYMEGPDIFSLSLPGRSPRSFYYLVYSVNIDSGDNDTGYIAYAVCSEQAFHASATSPADCWKFKGMIFRNMRTGRSNQASLVQFKGMNYVFFHKAPATCCADRSRARQVSALQFELRSNPGGDDDGEIVHVTHPLVGQSIDDLTLYGTLDGLAPDFDANGFITLRDEDEDPSKNTIKIDFGPMTNFTATTFSSHKQTFYYYFDVDPGCTVHWDTPPVAYALQLQGAWPLKHISQNTWAVVMDYVGPDLIPGDTISRTLLQLPMHCDSGTFNKLNDFSRPIGNYQTPTNRVAVFDNASNKLIAGRVPDTSGNTDTFKVLRTMHLDASSRYTYLRASYAQADVGINNQNLSGDTLQQWYLEKVTDFSNVQGLNVPGLPQLSDLDKQEAYRLRCKGTNNLYMTANDVNHGTYDNPMFYVLSQALRTSPYWATQIWIRMPANDGTGSYRFRSAWVPGPDKNSTPIWTYLNLEKGNSGDTGWQNVYLRPLDRLLDRQKWIEE